MSIPDQLSITGAGTVRVNTLFNRGVDVDAMPAWYSDDSLSLQSLSSTWVIKDIETDEIFYKTNNSIPPQWEPVVGINPTPTISIGV